MRKWQGNKEKRMANCLQPGSTGERGTKKKRVRKTKISVAGKVGRGVVSSQKWMSNRWLSQRQERNFRQLAFLREKKSAIKPKRKRRQQTGWIKYEDLK